jgi:hypothetical protein
MSTKATSELQTKFPPTPTPSQPHPHSHRHPHPHPQDWANTQAVCIESDKYKLLIKESLLIRTYQPELNRTTHSVPLHIFPNGVSKQYLPKLN